MTRLIPESHFRFWFWVTSEGYVGLVRRVHRDLSTLRGYICTTQGSSQWCVWNTGGPFLDRSRHNRGYSSNLVLGNEGLRLAGPRYGYSSLRPEAW